MKPAYVIALFVIALCMGVTFYAFSGAVAQHVTIAQVKTLPGEMAQVPGQVIKDTVTYDGMRGQLRFDMADLSDASQRLTVVYDQPKPENFDNAKSVEAIGRYENGEFKAHNLLVKCPSKYSDEKK